MRDDVHPCGKPDERKRIFSSDPALNRAIGVLAALNVVFGVVALCVLIWGGK